MKWAFRAYLYNFICVKIQDEKQTKFFYVLLTVVSRTNLVHKFYLYIYCFSLHVSGNYVPIIRRKYRTYAIPGKVSAGRNEIPPCIPDSHLYRVTNMRCRIGTVFSPDDGHIVARNM